MGWRWLESPGPTPGRRGRVNQDRERRPSARRRFAGWAVHAYTGSGLLLAAGITSLLLQAERTPETYRLCFLLMLLAIVIDGTDGALARWVGIAEAVPEFDG